MLGFQIILASTMENVNHGETALLANQGSLPKEAFDAIRAKWLEIAKAEWIGQG